MMKSYKNIAAIVLMFAALASTSACRTYKEGTLTEKKIQVSEEKFVREFAVDGTHYGALGEVAKHYSRYGGAGMHLTLIYNPASTDVTAMKATQEAADISNWLRREGGVDAIRSDILPVRDAMGMKAIISFASYNAQGPDCDSLMSGFDDRNHKTDLDYEMGCTVQTVIARQISRPKDLMGRDFENTHTDARGVSNQIEVFRSGAQNEGLGGEGTTN